MKFSLGVASAALVYLAGFVAAEQSVLLIRNFDVNVFTVRSVAPVTCTYTSVLLTPDASKVVARKDLCNGGLAPASPSFTFTYSSTDLTRFKTITDAAGNQGTCVPHCECQRKRATITISEDPVCPGAGCRWSGSYDCSIAKDYTLPALTTTTTTTTTTTKTIAPTKTVTVTTTVTQTSGCLPQKCSSGPYFKKKNGRGPKGACCHDQSDCIGDCRSNRCTYN